MQGAINGESSSTSPLDSDELLALLKGDNAKTLNAIREAHPEWLIALPDPRNFDLRRAKLAQVDLRGIDLSGIDFSWADLRDAKLDRSNLDRCNFVGANLYGVSLVGASFRSSIGLFGENRALYSPYVQSFNSGAEQATFMERGDHVPWSLLRSISTFRVFGASYFTIAMLVVYASWVEWVNTTAYSWATVVPADGGLRQQFREILLSRMPIIEVAPHFGIQILMVISLALGATIYHLFCPAFIKENSESRWTRGVESVTHRISSGECKLPVSTVSCVVFLWNWGAVYLGVSVCESSWSYRLFFERRLICLF